MPTDNKFDNKVKPFKKSYFKKTWSFIFGRTIPQKLFRAYIIIVFLGAALLYTPIALKNGYNMVIDNYHKTKPYSFWEALFISCSSITDTGLTPAIISDTYTLFGQIVMLILIEAGGIGLMTIIYFLWKLLTPKRNMDLNQIIMLQAERGNEKIGGTYQVLKKSVLFIIITQIAIAFLMSFWLCWFKSYDQTVYDTAPLALTYDNLNEPIAAYHNYALAFWQGLFTSVSAINNAGFDIFTKGVSLSSFRNDWNVLFQLMIMIEIIVGGIGFPLIFDFMEKIRYRKLKQKYRLTLFTKVALVGFAIVTAAGLIFSYSLEYAYVEPVSVQGHEIYDVAHYVCAHREFGRNEGFNKAWTLLFNTVSTRSAGMSTVNQGIFSPGSQWTYIILMFVGTSPSSTGGGIRTTTLVIVIWTMLSKIRGREHVNLFHKQIPKYKVRDAMLITIVATFLVALVSLITYYSIPNNVRTDDFSMLQVFYETASAFGTVGLSMGITSHIGHVGQVALIVLMFVGQLGISATLLSWTRKNPKGNLIEYPTEDVKIG